MRLSAQDKHEILKAAIKATDKESLTTWLASLVDAIDELPDGKYDAPVPRYIPAATVPVWSTGQWAQASLTGNGAAQP